MRAVEFIKEAEEQTIQFYNLMEWKSFAKKHKMYVRVGYMAGTKGVKIYEAESEDGLNGGRYFAGPGWNYGHMTIIIDKLDEMPLPTDWDPEQLNLRQTFKNRLKYALDRAKRLGGGSSRVAMIIEYEGRPTALKVAKNAKGLAQNEAEISVLDDGYLGNLSIVIPLIDYDKANNRPVWIQTEVAKKITAQTLMKLLHTPSMWLFTNKVRNILGLRKPHEMDDDRLKQQYFETHNNLWQPTEKDWDIFNEYASEVADLVGNSSLEPGDLASANNWGVYNGRPVIIDLGLSSDVWQQYYKPK